MRRKARQPLNSTTILTSHRHINVILGTYIKKKNASTLELCQQAFHIITAIKSSDCLQTLVVTVYIHYFSET